MNIDLDLFLLYAVTIAFVKVLLDAGGKIYAAEASPAKEVLDKEKNLERKKFLRLKLGFERCAMWVSLIGTALATLGAGGRIWTKAGNTDDIHVIVGWAFAGLLLLAVIYARLRIWSKRTAGRGRRRGHKAGQAPPKAKSMS